MKFYHGKEKRLSLAYAFHEITPGLLKTIQTANNPFTRPLPFLFIGKKDRLIWLPFFSFKSFFFNRKEILFGRVSYCPNPSLSLGPVINWGFYNIFCTTFFTLTSELPKLHIPRVPLGYMSLYNGCPTLLRDASGGLRIYSYLIRFIVCLIAICWM
jgi:hypothetical protein